MKLFQTHVFLCVLLWAAHASDFKSSVGTRLRRTRNHTEPESNTFVRGYTDNIAQTTGNVAPISGKTSPLQIDPSRNSSITPVRRVLKGRRPAVRKPINVPALNASQSSPVTPSSFSPDGTASVNVLASFAGQKRVLIISAPDKSNGYYKLMMNLLRRGAYCEMAERHMQLIVMFHGEQEQGGRVRRVGVLGSVTDEPLEAATVPRLMNALGLQEGKFSMVLLRKTLQVEERYPYPVRLEAVYEAVDHTPLRRLEKARQRGFVERCRAAGVEGQLVRPVRPEVVSSESHMRPAIRGGGVPDKVGHISKPTVQSITRVVTAVITRATTRPTTTSAATTKPATAAVMTRSTETPARTAPTRPSPTTPCALEERTHPQTLAHRHKTSTSTTSTMHSPQGGHANIVTLPSITTNFAKHKVRQKQQKISPGSSPSRTHTGKPVKEKLPKGKNTGRELTEEFEKKFKGGKPTVKESEENRMGSKDPKEPEENLRTTKNDKEPAEKLKTTKDPKEPEENLKTTKDPKEPEENLRTTKNDKEPAEKLRTTKDPKEPEENLKTTKDPKEPEENLKTTKDPKEPEENLKTTKDPKEPEENLRTTKDPKEPEENLKTTKDPKEPEENLRTTKDPKEPEENLMAAGKAGKDLSNQSERRKKMERPAKKSGVEKKTAKVSKEAESNVRSRNTAREGHSFEEKGIFRPTEKTTDAKRSIATFLSYFEKRRRLLVITSPNEKNSMYTQQRDEYLEQECDMALRKISIITIFGPPANGTMKINHYQMEQDRPVQVLPTSDLINQELITSFRKEFGMFFDDFYMVLTDLDMKVKQKYEVPIIMKAVFDYIDTFTSRLKEMELQRKLGIVCKKEDKSRSLENFLSRFRWRRRLLIISTPDPDEWAYQHQLYALTNQACHLGLRHMSVLKLVGGTVEDVTGVLELYPINGSARMEREDLASSLAHDIRNYFQVGAEYFSMLLVGKDGNVKSWYSSPVWSMATIYDPIDSMQLRRQEMAIQRSLGMLCPEEDPSHHSRYHDGYHYSYAY